MRIVLFAALVVTALLALTSSCDLRRGIVQSAPGETHEDLTAAREVLGAVGDSVPLISVRVASVSTVDERRAVGVVVGERQWVLVDAAPLSLSIRTAQGTEMGHTRAIEAIFHPGSENERRHPATVVRESADRGFALLRVEGVSPPAVSFGDDVADGTAAFLVTRPFNADRLIAEAGRVSEYLHTDEGRFLSHTAGYEPDSTGPVFAPGGELIGLAISGAPGERMAVPAVEIAEWLRTPAPGELSAVEQGQVLNRLLSQMDLTFRATAEGDGYTVTLQSGLDITARQTGGLIALDSDLGGLHVGDAMEALHANYSDPVGALALKPTEGVDQLVWVTRLPADAANAAYLQYILRMTDVQTARWEQIAAGLKPDYPYEYYPGGDTEELVAQLAEIIRQSGIPHAESGEGYKLYPDATVPIFVNEFRGMAYVYAYSGGMPGDDAAEQEQIARELIRRNWQMALGRFALDKHDDLAWEAQVPVAHLTPGHLAALARVGQDEIARIESTYGDIPFNEQ